MRCICSGKTIYRTVKLVTPGSGGRHIAIKWPLSTPTRDSAAESDHKIPEKSVIDSKFALYAK